MTNDDLIREGVARGLQSRAEDAERERDALRAEVERTREAARRWAERDEGNKAALRAEVERLSAWLVRIDGGDVPCDDAATLRSWAYEAITLGREVSDDFE